jgi:hypothetical protein
MQHAFVQNKSSRWFKNHIAQISRSAAARALVFCSLLHFVAMWGACASVCVFTCLVVFCNCYLPLDMLHNLCAGHSTCTHQYK